MWYTLTIWGVLKDNCRTNYKPNNGKVPNYKQDNFHYVIEVQLWADPDYAFNIWIHSDTYKYEDPKVTLELRKLYDCGIIKNYNDFRKELNKYE